MCQHPPLQSVDPRECRDPLLERPAVVEPGGSRGEPATVKSRRSLLAGAAAAVAGLSLADLTQAAPATAARPSLGAEDQVVLLGVDGGPVLHAGRTKPAIALVVNGETYLVDAGLGTAEQMVAAGLGFATLKNVFVTHHHFDHTSGLIPLITFGWTSLTSKLTELHIWGPAKMEHIKQGMLLAYQQEIAITLRGNSLGSFPKVSASSVHFPDHRPGPRAGAEAPGVRYPVRKVMEDDNVVVHATKVYHGPGIEAFAYRFTIKSSGKRVVFSGDTDAPNPALIQLARDADVVVHETQDNDNVEIIVQSVPPASQAQLRESLITAHSDVRDLPRVGKRAGAGKIVMSHYTPFPQPASIYLAKAQKSAAAVGYSGGLIAPEQSDSVAI